MCNLCVRFSFPHQIKIYTAQPTSDAFQVICGQTIPKRILFQREKIFENYLQNVILETEGSSV